jgi:hypothetical protein
MDFSGDKKKVFLTYLPKKFTTKMLSQKKGVYLPTNPILKFDVTGNTPILLFGLTQI